MTVNVRTALLPCMLLLSAVLLCGPALVGAQEDYPIPPGNPEGWKSPGTPDTLATEPPSAPNPLSAPPPPGNVELNEPSVPAGEAEEVYTGTAEEFGGIAGTGIGPSGVQPNR